ncbi:MAG: 5'/3'-nucleotidase SurE [Alphaproteobacteria bacterium]|nr:5'/3'-nucleotidase SurE [Alphaproteobacteria bacterium]MBV9420120.1 5'/3'-nucleotidase SurE [Alphaproteobacteria bacterium]MBV9542072.1 5'/3'-nucleotidase SurE [Alphaproteobacteria bacterium]MBV9903857.1 5'/3'-nucleotidase SurE [Alphaproteobacteria bacterium]
MRILVTNDDGIHAPGLGSAEKIARSLTDDVWVVAPEIEQSGASHSLTLALPLRLRQVEKQRFAVSGTPTDCVMMACTHVLKDRKPDLVLSGVNAGSNIAEDVTYSGTVAGAMEGTALGIPAIALSQSYGFGENAEIQWACCESHGPKIVRALMKQGWPEGVLMNVNFPDAPPDQVKDAEVVSQGQRDSQAAAIERRTDARNRPYFWIGFKKVRSNPPQGTDLHAIYNKRIAITPLHLNLTEFQVMEKMRQGLGKIAL